MWYSKKPLQKLHRIEKNLLGGGWPQWHGEIISLLNPNFRTIFFLYTDRIMLLLPGSTWTVSSLKVQTGQEQPRKYNKKILFDLPYYCFFFLLFWNIGYMVEARIKCNFVLIFIFSNSTALIIYENGYF